MGVYIFSNLTMSTLPRRRKKGKKGKKNLPSSKKEEHQEPPKATQYKESKKMTSSPQPTLPQETKIHSK